MAKKIIRAGIVAVLAGATLMAALPAQATQIRPHFPQGEEYLLTYYSNAQETTIVGEYAYGSCPKSYVTGTSSAYYTVHVYQCPS